MGIYSIYRITNLVNGKCYIGFSCRRAKQRWACHAHDSRKKRPTSLIGKAIKKYGIEAFIFEIIYQTHDKNHGLDSEIMLIKEHNSHCIDGHGYNVSYGGTAPMMGLKHTEESKRSMSINTSGSKNPMFGKKHSAETRAKIKAKRALQVISDETKALWRKNRKGKPKPRKYKGWRAYPIKGGEKP